MTDLSIRTDWTTEQQAQNHWIASLNVVAHRFVVLGRRARRDRYVSRLVATIGVDRAADAGIDTRRRHYDWLGEMVRAMSGR